MTTTVKTTCPYCGVGCGVNLSLPANPNEVVPPVSGDLDHPAKFWAFVCERQQLGANHQVRRSLAGPPD